MKSFPLVLTALSLSASFALACSSSSTPASGDGGGLEDTKANDTSSPIDTGGPIDTGIVHDTGTRDTGADTGTGMTIAKARMGNVTTAITVDAIVMAQSGQPPKDTPITYIEDPAGGMYSGVAVYCDPDDSCDFTQNLALGDLVRVTGTLSPYKGQVELIPTALTVVSSGATMPPVATVTAADVAPTADSPYRGVFVKLTIATSLKVENVVPAALFDTSCGTVPPDAGTTKKGKDGGAGDAGLPQCSPLCEPPVYSGFLADDGTGNEVYVEAPFFSTDPLQSSPECLTQSGVVPVKVGATFSAMSGILDYDGYGMVQAISPVTASDYATP